MPASDAAACQVALAGPYDLVVLDLEDTVKSEQKPRARIMLRTGLSADWASDVRCVVRLNPWDSHAGAVDRMALSGLQMPAAMLPKIASESDVKRARDGLIDTDIGASNLHAIIETAEGLANVRPIAEAGVASLVLGAFDLAKALDVEPEPSSKKILEARAQVASAAKMAKVLSFDMPWIDGADQAGFEAHIRQAKELGFTGCCAMNQDQATQINALWSPGS